MFDIFDIVEENKEQSKSSPSEKNISNVVAKEKNKDSKKSFKNTNSPYDAESIKLSFLENDITGHVIIGRKKNVFEKYGEEGALFIGKVYEKSYPEKEVYFDSLDPQVVFICGSRGSGKSYCLGVIAEELAIKNPNVGMIVIDPVGVFWSMKYPNRQKYELKLLEEWNLEAKGLDNVFVFVPKSAEGKVPKETYDAVFTIQPSFLTAEDWALTFNIDRFSPQGLLLEKALKKVKQGYRTIDSLIVKGKNNNFSIDDIIHCLKNDSELNSKEYGYKKDSIRALISRFEASKDWGIFAKQGTPLIEISVPGQLTIIDTSFLDDTVSALLTGIIARRVLSARKIATRKHAAKKFSDKKEDLDTLEYDIPPTWLFIDEAHTLIPSGTIETPASKAIIEYVKQGRRPGCSLVFATQQPSAIDTRVLSQVGTLISYKLVFDDDIKAVFRRMPTVVPKEYKNANFIKRLEVGLPLVADRVETTSRAFVMKVRPRMSQHEGRETQTAEIKNEYSEKELLEIMATIARSKIERYKELDFHSLKTLLKILNMKYKSDIDFDKFIIALADKDIKISDDKAYIEEEEDEEYYREQIKYKIIKQKYELEQIEGIAKRSLAWKDYIVKLVYRPLWKINYKIYSKEGGFVNNIAYFDPVKCEFIHKINNGFIYSSGIAEIKDFDSEALRLILRLPSSKGFDLDYLHEISTFGDAKLKNIMASLINKGLVRKEKRGRRNIYFLIKDLEIPKNPLNKLLSSLNDIELVEEEVDVESILEPMITMEAFRSFLGSFWGRIKIEDIETILRKEYMFKDNISNMTALFETYYAKKVE